MKPNPEGTVHKLAAKLNKVALVGSRVAVRGLASVIVAALLIVLARELGPTKFGVFSIALAIGYLVAAILSLGTTTRVLRVQAENDITAVLPALTTARIVGACIAAAAAFAIGDWLVTPSVALIAGSIVLVDAVGDYTQAAFAGVLKHTRSLVAIIVQRGGAAVAMVLVVAMNQPIVTIAYALLACAAVLILWVGHETGWTLLISPAVKKSSGYWFATISANVNQLDAPIIGYFAGSTFLGSYSITSRVVNPLYIFMNALQMVFVPELSRRRGPAFAKLSRMLYLCGGAYALALCALAVPIADITPAVLGDAYRDVRVLMISMVIGAAISVLSQVVYMRMLALGRPGRTAAVISGMSLVNAVAMGVTYALAPAAIWVVFPAVQLIILAAVSSQSKKTPSPEG